MFYDQSFSGQSGKEAALELIDISALNFIILQNEA
jgi:hypothetical protein